MSGNGQGHALPPRPDVPLAGDPDDDQEVKPLTRKRLAPWDRMKILILLLGAFMVLVWSTMAEFAGLISFGDAFVKTVEEQWWLLALAGLELIRQIHYVICEHSAGYNQFWLRRIEGFHRRTGKMNDWTRYRVARAIKVVFFLIILDLVLAKILDLSPALALFQLPALIWHAIPFVLQLAFGFFFVILQFVGLFWFLSRGGSDLIFPEDIDTRFKDVKGQDSVLAKVKETVLFLENPESIEEKGGKVPKGILLWGPPGTGKTMMAKAVAGETSKPFIFVDPGAFIQMFMGVGLLKVKALFRKARKMALRYGGVIMFFDEADSLGNRGIATGQGAFARPADQAPGPWATVPPCNGMSYLDPRSQSLLLRSGLTEPGSDWRRDGIIAGMGGMGGGMGVLPALLSELDGMEKPRGFLNRHLRRALGMKPKPPPKYRILTMMATNMPEALDPALLRPGRIDRSYKVGYPSKVGRIDTYQRYLGKVSHAITEEEIDRIATITPYYGGASIEDLVNAALINAIEHGRDTIEWQDLVKAKQLKDLGPPEDVEYIERERHSVAVHEASHAVVAYRTKHHLLIDIATIEKGGSYLGMVAFIPPEDQFTQWRSEFEADIMSALASLVGEKMFFGGDSTSGVSSDLEKATRMATAMEGYWGMGSTVTSHGVTHEVGIGGGGRPGSGEKGEKGMLEGTLGGRIEEKLAELVSRTEQLLAAERHAVLAVAHALETNKTLTGEDVAAIIDGVPGPLIDGRPYHSEQFLAKLETYHAEAVQAHRAHTKPNLPLPRLAPSPVLAAVGVVGPAAGNGETHPTSADPSSEDGASRDPANP